MKKKKRIIRCALGVGLLAVTAWVLWANTALEQNAYTLSCNKLPQEFDGYRIAHVSDLHNRKIGKDNSRLLDILEKAQPDIIAITGDLIDSRSTKVEVALDFAEQAVKIAPCYYVPGNHESRVEEYDALKVGLEKLGVTVLENEQQALTVGDSSIQLLGVTDPDFPDQDLEAALTELHDPAQFTVLLSHRPELFDTYSAQGVDLVLSGHAHGGQFRLPIVGGLYAPAQGFLPEYDAGLYTEGSTSMLVSRGIGNSLFPLRFNNRPEVILIELNSA